MPATECWRSRACGVDSRWVRRGPRPAHRVDVPARPRGLRRSTSERVRPQARSSLRTWTGCPWSTRGRCSSPASRRCWARVRSGRPSRSSNAPRDSAWSTPTCAVGCGGPTAHASILPLVEGADLPARRRRSSPSWPAARAAARSPNAAGSWVYSEVVLKRGARGAAALTSQTWVEHLRRRARILRPRRRGGRVQRRVPGGAPVRRVGAGGARAGRAERGRRRVHGRRHGVVERTDADREEVSMTRDAQRPTDMPRPRAAYSPVVVAGPLVFTAGQVAFGPDDTLVAGGVEEQTRQVLDNVERCLASAGCEMDDVVKVTAFLSEFADFEAYNRVYEQRIRAVPRRARPWARSSRTGFSSRSRPSRCFRRIGESVARRTSPRPRPRRRRRRPPRATATGRTSSRGAVHGDEIADAAAPGRHGRGSTGAGPRAPSPPPRRREPPSSRPRDGQRLRGATPGRTTRPGGPDRRLRARPPASRARRPTPRTRCGTGPSPVGPRTATNARTSRRRARHRPPSAAPTASRRPTASCQAFLDHEIKEDAPPALTNDVGLRRPSSPSLTSSVRSSPK